MYIYICRCATETFAHKGSYECNYYSDCQTKYLNHVKIWQDPIVSTRSREVYATSIVYHKHVMLATFWPFFITMSYSVDEIKGNICV